MKLVLFAVAVFAPALALPQVPADGQWPMPSRTPDGTPFSPLAQVTTANAAQLKLAFSMATGVVRGHQSATLVVDDTMYFVTPYPNAIFALDRTQPGASVKWRFDAKPDPNSQGVACCDVVNRGAIYSNGRLFFNTLAGATIALDARSGKQLWRVKLGNIKLGESMTMAPLVVKDKVLVGNSGGEFGVRGWLTALDAATGKIAWRAYSTGPDKDVLIEPSFRSSATRRWCWPSSRRPSCPLACGCAPHVRELGKSFFTAASLLIAIPSAIQIYCWIATMWTGRLNRRGRARPRAGEAAVKGPAVRERAL